MASKHLTIHLCKKRGRSWVRTYNLGMNFIVAAVLCQADLPRL